MWCVCVCAYVCVVIYICDVWSVCNCVVGGGDHASWDFLETCFMTLLIRGDTFLSEKINGRHRLNQT